MKRSAFGYGWHCSLIGGKELVHLEDRVEPIYRGNWGLKESCVCLMAKNPPHEKLGTYRKPVGHASWRSYPAEIESIDTKGGISTESLQEQKGRINIEHESYRSGGKSGYRSAPKRT